MKAILANVFPSQKWKAKKENLKKLFILQMKTPFPMFYFFLKLYCLSIYIFTTLYSILRWEKEETLNNKTLNSHIWKLCIVDVIEQKSYELEIYFYYFIFQHAVEQKFAFYMKNKKIKNCQFKAKENGRIFLLMKTKLL